MKRWVGLWALAFGLLASFEGGPSGLLTGAVIGAILGLLLHGSLRAEIERQKLNVHLQVDGGITVETIRQTRDAGANVSVASTSVFGQQERTATIKALRAAAD